MATSLPLLSNGDRELFFMRGKARKGAERKGVDLGLTFRGRFLLIDQPDGVLGRNILNLLNMTFDGPRLSWDRVK